MVWIFAAVVLFLFVAIPGFRNTILVLLGILIVVGIFVFKEEAKNQEARKIEEDRVSKIERALISSRELVFSNVMLTESQGSWYIKGRVENNSTHTLKEFKIKMTFQDCPINTKEQCKVYGENSIDIKLMVPSKQVRDFTAYAPRPTSNPIGRMEWYYIVSDIKGLAPN